MSGAAATVLWLMGWPIFDRSGNEIDSDDSISDGSNGANVSDGIISDTSGQTHSLQPRRL